MSKFEDFIKCEQSQSRLSPLAKRYTEEQVSDVLMQSKGVMTIACNLLDCTYGQLTYFIREHHLEPVVNASRKQLVSLAEETLLGCLSSDNEKTRLQAAEFVLKSQGQEEGWGQVPVVATEVKLPDGVELRQIFGIGNAQAEMPKELEDDDAIEV